MAILENVVFYYCKIQKPVKGLNEGDSEFTVDACVSKAAAKAWNAEHVKNKVRVIDTDAFEEKYKTEPPFPDQESQYLIKFKKIHAKKGVELPEKFRPRVFMAGDDGKARDVTFEVLPANGSTGKVSYSTFNGPAKFPGVFVQLDAIFVEDLAELDPTDGGGDGGLPGSDFGVTELAKVPDEAKKVVKKQTDNDDPLGDDEPPEEKPKKVATPSKPVKPNKPSKPPVDDDMDDDIPF